MGKKAYNDKYAECHTWKMQCAKLKSKVTNNQQENEEVRLISFSEHVLFDCVTLNTFDNSVLIMHCEVVVPRKEIKLATISFN